jgi:hypothetical protein
MCTRTALFTMRLVDDDLELPAYSASDSVRLEPRDDYSTFVSRWDSALHSG